MANFIGISPGQLNPHAWRVLITIQVFSEIYSVSLGLEEVLFVYFFKCYDSVNYRYLIQKRRPDSSPLVYDLDRQVRYKTPYEKQWHKKFVFMRLGRDPAIECDKFPEGVNGVTRAFDFTKEQREVLFLTSFFALEKSSIWGYEMSILDAVPGDGSIRDDALQLFREAMSDIPASITAPPLQTLQPSSQVGPKRSATTANLTRQPARTAKRKFCVCLGGSLLTASDHSIALGNLRKQVFPRDREALNELGHAAILEKSQHHLLEVARLKEANQLLKKDKEAEILRRDSLITAKEAEGEALKDQVYDLTS
ncbi:unnamed protein product [Arabis nemorensis]|uniref:Uncharacterized protein n=1 Tax=Arabis nemorensis TaxID=586526 RepID=A0A565B9R2_9BRAS|nr:unnamed protein product [Arabis nemorensis]